MKHTRIFYHTLAALLLSASTLMAQKKSSGPVEVNGIAAKVNGHVVTKNQVSIMLAPVFGQLRTQYPRGGPVFEKKLNEAKDNIIQELVDRQIILDEFKQLGANIPEHLVDQEVKRQVQQLFNGNEKMFNEELKKSRMTQEAYRKMTREKMIVQAMRSEHFSDAPPPLPSEVRAEYEKNKLSLRDTSKDSVTYRKIFIPAMDQDNPASTPEDQLKIAENAVKSLNGGKDFGSLAKEISKDAHAENGGLQEKVPRSDLSAEFAAIIFDTPVNKVAGPLLSPSGFTILEPVKFHYGPSPPLSEVREQMTELVTRKKTSAKYEQWIKARRKKAMIDVRM